MKITICKFNENTIFMFNKCIGRFYIVLYGKYDKINLEDLFNRCRKFYKPQNKNNRYPLENLVMELCYWKHTPPVFIKIYKYLSFGVWVNIKFLFILGLALVSIWEVRLDINNEEITLQNKYFLIDIKL